MSSPEVEVGGGVEFGDDYVDVVAAHTCAEGCEAVAAVGARQGVQLAVLAFVFNAVEQLFKHIDAIGVANQKDVVGQVVAIHIDMVEVP